MNTERVGLIWLIGFEIPECKFLDEEIQEVEYMYSAYGITDEEEKPGTSSQNDQQETRE